MASTWSATAVKRSAKAAAVLSRSIVPSLAARPRGPEGRLRARGVIGQPREEGQDDRMAKAGPPC